MSFLPVIHQGVLCYIHLDTAESSVCGKVEKKNLSRVLQRSKDALEVS